MGATLTNYDAVVRELWPQRRINNMTYETSAYWAMVKKDPTFTEKIRHIAFGYGNPQGRSADFATAQANAGNSQLGEFQVTRVSDYAVGIVDGETLETTKDNKAAIVSAIEQETSGALEELGNTLSFDLWRSGTGSRGTVGTSGISTTTLTLADSDDVVNFEVGMEVVLASSETGALRDSGNSATITEVDFDNGQLVTDSNWTTQISGATDGDHIFVEGDAAAGGSIVKVSGVEAWIPTSTPSSTAFFGLDRTTHPTRMAGIRYDGSSDGTIKEAIKKLHARIAAWSGNKARPTDVFMHPEDLDNLDIELGTDRRYARVDVKDADVGFDAITFHTPAGAVRVIQDRYVKKGYAWSLDMRTWTFGSVMGVPRIIQHDGNRMLRQSSADGVEFRAVYRGQLYCNAPGYNGVVTLPA